MSKDSKFSDTLAHNAKTHSAIRLLNSPKSNCESPHKRSSSECRGKVI